MSTPFFDYVRSDYDPINTPGGSSSASQRRANSRGRAAGSLTTLEVDGLWMTIKDGLGGLELLPVDLAPLALGVLPSGGRALVLSFGLVGSTRHPETHAEVKQRRAFCTLLLHVPIVAAVRLWIRRVWVTGVLSGAQRLL
ncbi:hypothetical protein EYF80_045517 [Liparis tanakae]|uniref:Uncharacterized protein n=1 Tax=Liparis tanakae TaxID=230148 RepID=A0A4Z2FVD1_9TELE|nr:hypothetical protein EYF80_045517 [Liparis tanakae]